MAPWIDLEVPVNFRDLGGTPVEGGTVTHGLVYRSDSLVGLSTNDVRQLSQELGIRTVFDLRSESEVKIGRTELADLGIAYHHLPIGQRLGSLSGGGPGAVTMAEGYLAMFKASAATLVRALEVLSTDDARPLVFHCAGGKDRAGLMAATVLNALGATPETIATEYALTSRRFDRVLARLNAEPQYRAVIAQVDQEALTSDPETMLGFLRLVAEHHAAIPNFLAKRGLTPALVDQLRAGLVTPPV